MLANSITEQLPIAPGEKRVALRGLDWLAYQQMKAVLNERTGARLAYDRGTLEITMPSEPHEFYARLIERFIIILVVELGLQVKTLGSTTLDREDLDRGSEPDNGYYIQNQPQVAGRTVDLAVDPPPDLVVEIDISHTDIDKNALYAAMGVPEFWRFDGKFWRIYQLRKNAYVEVDSSPTFPMVAKEKLYEFLSVCQQSEVDAEINFRTWVREQM
ncbi:Uma2 family endonuclease [Leptolyngbya cf. ectocarpi LEGE 11479]|uniref:Uma2 family endonuclease n=1 Tax=Leptolyngbya cf. ectocarpi LEGE 11479 TaxID=1828722 RepID=A0A929F5B4_LEPEC|nr:Uma2 family endonuclease [Leptolyngbya ectocarpi]MBE9067505.1 Uma2 family endonuclease [Leptolyngbya cf. ectocarpi LEGE 11479]